MDFGKVEYIIFEAGNSDFGVSRKLNLTLVGQNDDAALREGGLAGLRRRRIIRLTNEAARQGALLSYEDLAGLLLTSLATLKRDIGHLEKEGHAVPRKGRKRNGNGGL
ncbi:MAG: DUF1670 domain-containing protein [Thermodesulfovibrionales bacterium]|nr:DUF1670 domain-containing protein [Thermodesulfovibrionales bacterium]